MDKIQEVIFAWKQLENWMDAIEKWEELPKQAIECMKENVDIILSHLTDEEDLPDNK